jgi:uncharacterized protein YjbI with pentapeptide repeats
MNAKAITFSSLKVALKRHSDWLELKGGEQLDLSSSEISHCWLPQSEADHWIGKNFSRARLGGFEACGIDFSECDFSGADLRGAIFYDCIFDDAEFRGALLTGAKFDRASFDGADLRGAKFTSELLTADVLNKVYCDDEQLPFLVVHTEFSRRA